jgi:hypothetical protein
MIELQRKHLTYNIDPRDISRCLKERKYFTSISLRECYNISIVVKYHWAFDSGKQVPLWSVLFAHTKLKNAEIITGNPVHAVTSIKQSPVLKGYIFLVLS